MKGTLPQRVRLGVFEVDLRAGELRQDEGAVLLLSDQPLQILRILIEADGEMVTREEIRQRLPWPDDTIVEFDSSINNAIKKLAPRAGRFRRRTALYWDDCQARLPVANSGGTNWDRRGRCRDSRRTADPSAPSAADSARDDTQATLASGNDQRHGSGWRSPW